MMPNQRCASARPQPAAWAVMLIHLVLGRASFLGRLGLTALKRPAVAVTLRRHCSLRSALLDISIRPRQALVVLVVGLVGCASPVVRPQSPEAPEESENGTRVIGDVAVPYGIHPVKVEAVALVTGLRGTGSDPPPSPNRAVLLQDMQRRGVRNPNSLLSSSNTALVLVTGYLRPGIQKGDRFDLEIKVPTGSETASLRGGWLMETRLKELAVLDGAIHEGHDFALGAGPLMVDPQADEKSNPAGLRQARVLGGGVSLTSRSLQLVVHTDQSALQSSQIGQAINKRFHISPGGIKRGVANPRTDERIDLEVHPRYKHNVLRYIQVVRSIAMRESAADRVTRLASLERQLLDPVTAASAAIRLEAIGKEAIPALQKGIQSSDPEVRFYAAEALAYLDDGAAVAPLADAIRHEPAFRSFALAALSAMDDMNAYDALIELLSVSSAETRYGAFRALWAMNPKDRLVVGERMGDQFSYHLLSVGGPPMIHLTRSFRPEVVVFGAAQQFELPLLLEAGNEILVTEAPGGQVAVSRFAVGKPDQKRLVSPRVDDVIRAIVDLGGTYPDVVQMLQGAKESGVLKSRLAIDALPEIGRTYDRDEGSADDEEAEPPGRNYRISSPRPDLFGERTEASDETGLEADRSAETPEEAESAESPASAG